MTDVLAAPMNVAEELEWRDNREKVASRLLKATAERHYDPRVDLDWNQPFQPDKFFLCQEHVSLYGTPLWDRMSFEQRIELSKHESASWLSAGIAFEMQLDAFLLRHAFVRDPTSQHVRYALTEIEDECRHSLMFSMMLEKMGTPLYSFQPKLRALIWRSQFFGSEVLAFIGTLIVEEFLDAAQRQIMRDDDVQPLVREMTTIHVVEEARHVSYARSELARQVERIGPKRLALVRQLAAFMAAGIYKMLVDPAVYASVGIDSKLALEAVNHSEHRRQFRRDLTARTFRNFSELGLVGGRSTQMWRAWGHDC
jgi:hypothetical protein